MRRKWLGKLCAMAALCLLSGRALAAPENGWWWNPAETGRGFFIEIAGDQLFMAGYFYEADGRGTWLISGGKVSGADSYAGKLLRISGGQTLVGDYRLPTTSADAGAITLQFSDAMHGTLTWPGGSISIQRQIFGSGTASFQPTGWWWNSAENGRGFSIEVQGDTLFMAGFMYDGTGNPVWYITSGKMASPTRYLGTLTQIAGGQTLTGPYKLPVTQTAVGSVTIDWASIDKATLTLSDSIEGGSKTIARQLARQLSNAPAAVALTDSQAARFLLQAQFSASDAEIASVRADGFSAWLNGQFNAPASITGWNWLDSRGYNVISNGTRYYDMEYVSDRMIWNQLMTSPDAVRKRVALALSEFFVVSVSGVELVWRPYAMASYWDALVANAFGNFRPLLEDISLNMATGKFLNTLGNQKEDASGRQPDENYAREVMQLYTIGLYQLNLDGTDKRDGSGNKIETYTPDDVSNLARVFTGYLGPSDPSPGTLVPGDSNRTIPGIVVARPPMILNANRHSTLAATFLGTTIAANTDGATALKIGLDTLFRHPNVGPFFSKQMIQRLVTSNPSPVYVARVAAVFNNNGNGVRGDLKAVFAAILLDDEARGAAGLTQSGSGKLREPMLRLVQWGRTFADQSVRDSWKMGNHSDPATSLGQSPLHAASVFNFFRPGYVPPSTALAASQSVAPEFQIVNESTVGGYLNTMQQYIRFGIFTPWSDVIGNKEGGISIPANYTNELALATDTVALVSRLNLLLCAGRLSAATQALIIDTLNATPVTATSTSDAKLNRVATAVLLVMASPDYLVQK